jgi:S1-C subfamily serine protease
MKKSLKKLGAVITLSAAVLFSSINAPHLHNSYLRYEVGQSSVKVMVAETGGGSGFAITAASGKAYIATNKHVCDAAPKGWVKIVTNDGMEAWKKIIYIDRKHDICLVEGDARLAPLEMASSPAQGDIHYIVGYPGLRPLTVSSGEFVGFASVQVIDDSPKTKDQCYGEIFDLSPVEQFFFGREWVCIRTYKSYSSSAVAYGGNSGSPVVNKYGNVIGILFAGPRDQEHVSMLVPGYELQRVLNKF